MRKTLIIITGVLLIAAIGGGAYMLFFAHRAHVVVAPSTTAVTFPTTSAGAATNGTGAATSSRVAITKSFLGASTIVNSTGELSRLVKITSGQVVPGIVVFDATSTATSTSNAIVRYINRKSGDVYSYDVLNGTLSRLSNKTIPGIEDASWLSDGSIAYVRYFSNTENTNSVSTYALPANGIGGFFLPQDLSGVAVYANSALTTLSSNQNGSLITRAEPDDSRAYTVFTTPLSSIKVSFAGPNDYLVYTKPSAAIGGYAFVVHKKTGAWDRVAGPLYGLVAKASPDGSTILVSYVGASNAMQMELVDTSTHSVVQLPVATIANKCVWTADSKSIYCGIPTNPPKVSYPDDWYQGVASFNDKIWKINVASRYAQLVLGFSKETQGAFDTETLAVDPNNTILSFVNKNDGSLWEYKL